MIKDKLILVPSSPTRVNDVFSQDSTVDCSTALPKMHDLIISDPYTVSTAFRADFYQHIACDIVCETVLSYPYPYVSEKSLRPFACKRMLIILGSKGILKLLRTKGFKTFGDFIDETYDDIDDASERFLKVSDEIHKLCKRPLFEIVNYMTENVTTFEHNYQTLVNLKELEINSIKSQINQFS
jgi:hypothetical protein